MSPLIRYILSLLLIISTVKAFAASIELPSIGDSSQSVISNSMEKHIGRAFMRNIHYKMKLVQDPEINAYVQDLGSQLSDKGNLSGQTFHFFVVDNPTINAFAAPGGFIGIHSGLILASESEDELASVLAHEIAHITQRHMARAYEEAGRLNLPITAALIAAILLGGQNVEITEAAIASTIASSTQNRLNFTRSNEKEADRVGMQILVDAGFSPHGMPRFFERLHTASRYADNALPEFLRTHPITLSRIADSRNRASQHPSIAPADSSTYQIIKTKLQLQQHSDPQHSKQIFSERIKNHPTTTYADNYGYALSLINQKKHGEAEKILLQLTQQDWERSFYLTALANNAMQDNDINKAASYFEKALQIYPYSESVTTQYSRALLNMRKAEQALRVIGDYNKNRPLSAPLYAILAEAYQKTGDETQSHKAMAEYYYALYDYHSALKQLSIAKQHSKTNTPLLAAIQSRIDEITLDIKSESAAINTDNRQ